MKYFTRRIPKNKIDYDNYWGTPTDPDGVVRDMSSEHEAKEYAKNQKQEIDFINSLPGGVLLDVGCGVGHFLRNINDKFIKFGLEPNKTACKVASKYAPVSIQQSETTLLQV